MNSLLEPVVETDMQQFCVEMMKRLDSQRRNEHFCDVVLEIGSGDDQARLKAHRIVLCAASPFFYNALNSDMKEKKEGVIRLKDTNRVLMEEVLEYVYTGDVDVNEENAYDLMALGDYLLIPSLKHRSSNFIEETLSVSNCIMAYYSSVKYQCVELQERARKFVLANFMAVTESEDFLNLNVKQVEEWIASDELVVKGEEQVFMAILRWTEKNAQRKQSFFELFRHVRCVYVSRNYLVTVILKHELVKSKKQCLDLVLDAMNEVSDGTESCFLNQSPRNCLKTYEDAIFACGGYGSDKMLCYVPSESKWYGMAGLHIERSALASDFSAYQGKLFVIGGNTNGCAVERYEPSLNSWTSVKSFKQTIKFAAAVTFQGFLYVIGGLDVDNSKRLSTVQRYDLDSNLWQEVLPLSSPRSSLCAVADGNCMYAIGGVTSDGVCNIVEKFDPEVNSWNRLAPTKEKRKNPCGVSLQSKIFVFGGVNESNGSPCEVYDTATNVWTNIASAIAPRFPASAVCFKGQIFVFGEFGPNQGNSQEKTLQVYDPDKEEWKACQNVSSGPYFRRLAAVRVLREVLDSCKEVSN